MGWTATREGRVGGPHPGVAHVLVTATQPFFSEQKKWFDYCASVWFKLYTNTRVCQLVGKYFKT